MKLQASRRVQTSLAMDLQKADDDRHDRTVDVDASQRHGPAHTTQSPANKAAHGTMPMRGEKV